MGLQPSLVTLAHSSLLWLNRNRNHTSLTRHGGLKSFGNSLPFILQIFRNSFATSSYFPLTVNHRGDSGTKNLHGITQSTNCLLLSFAKLLSVVAYYWHRRWLLIASAASVCRGTEGRGAKDAENWDARRGRERAEGMGSMFPSPDDRSLCTLSTKA